MASTGVLRCGCALLLTTMLVLGATTTPCAWNSRTIDANASIINITVPAIGKCEHFFTNNDVFFLVNNTFVGMKSGRRFPFLREEVEGVPALRILIKNATNVYFLYLICQHNDKRYAITIARNNYTARIHALNATLYNYVPNSNNETGFGLMEGVRRTKINLDILTGLENMRPINQDICATGDNVSMTWTFPRGTSGEHALWCRSSKSLLCFNPKMNDATDLCHLEQHEEFVTYTHIARRSEEKTVIYNCVLNGGIVTTKVLHWRHGALGVKP